MSYRTVKRILGETSLERKCRFFLGGGILVLILLSFFCYSYVTENLVWEQTRLTAELLVNPMILKRHWSITDANVEKSANVAKPKKQPDELDKLMPSEGEMQNYEAQVYRPLAPGSGPSEYSPKVLSDQEMLDELNQKKRAKDEHWRIDSDRNVFQYMKAIRLEASCLTCHPTALDRQLGQDKLAEGDMIAAVRIRLPLNRTELALNGNRAILISFAVFTAVLAMVLSYLIVRYVIVKPVMHLKEVSDEIASGNLTIRSEINTGDEFEQLSHAFNRMIRSLVTMQDELRQVNSDLDEKLDELAQANMALFEMNRMKSDFLATISHELRTPLHSILGFSDLVAEVETLSAKQKRWAQNIQTSGKQLLTLINDILDLAKLEAGKMQVRVEEFSLRDLIEGQLQLIRPLADKKNITIEAEINPAIPILKQDPDKLKQILDNLLSNAIKFTPEGGKITVAANADRAHVVLDVTDTGVGIAAEDQAVIFEKFRQAESSMIRVHGGTGLGLSIVRELSKLLGGEEIELESELGRGSTFRVRIPMFYTEQASRDLILESDSAESRELRNTEVRYYSSRERSVRHVPNARIIANRSPVP